MKEIDLVYLWVNGNDSVWVAKRDAYIGKPMGKQENCTARYADSGELKYSLRSVEKYAPWIHKIFIVTDNQVPEWLDTTHPKIQIIDHSEILPKESLPCFNSTLLEHFLQNIPGLSEYYIYGNDDTYINQPVSPNTFFADDNVPIIYMFRKPFRKFTLQFTYFFREKILKKPMNLYVHIVRNAALLVEKKYGKFFNCKPHHNFDAYLKSTVTKISKDFKEEISAMHTHHQRFPNDIHRSLYNFVALAESLGHLCYVSSKHSFTVSIHKRKHYQKLKEYNPIFFCMNDTPHATNSDREYSINYLSRLFPEKSQFEK